MGSLVGAAYASGMTLPEMDEVMKGISTELLFKDKPPRQELSMRRKKDDYDIFAGPEIGLGSGDLNIGKGLVTGIQLEAVLRSLSKVKGFHRFDELAIPFRAVATDLVTGKAVVFSEGELANVMRASMSVPGAVAPAEFGGMMLVDGMLTSNLPVQTARAMGADVVIAVNVGTPLLKREKLTGILGVSSQVLSILTEQNVQASIDSLKSTDILISPDLGDYSTGDFDALPGIVPLGEAAARRVSERLAALSIPATEYAAMRKRQMVEVKPDLRPVDEIRIGSLQSVNPRAVEAVMETEAGEPIDQKVLDRDIARIYGLGNFETVNYSFLEEPGRRILVVNAVEKTWGLESIRLGLGLSSDFQSASYFNVIGSYRRYWLNSLGAEWRTDLQIGRTSGMLSEFYQPFSAESRFFIAPFVNYERRTSDIYQGDERLASYAFESAAVGLDLGSVLGQYGELRVGVLKGRLNPDLEIGPAALSPGPSVQQGAVRARLVLDQMDSVHFARQGWRGAATLYRSSSSLGADETYTRWDIDGSVARSIGPHTFNVGFKAGGRIGSDPLPRYELFQWGGFLQQSGYATGQLIGEKIAFGRAMYYHRILKGSLLEGAYGGLSLEAGKVGDPLVPGSPDGLLKSGSVFVGIDTLIGPAYLAYGQASGGTRSLYFFLGRAF
jgi:NTE family protein